MDISPKLVSQLMKENNIRVRTNSEQAKIYHCNDNYFETIDTEHKAYWLGLMYTDGFITQAHYQNCMGLTLSSCDKKLLEEFKKDLEYTGDVKSYIPNKEKITFNTKEYSRLLITSDKLVKDLINKGCFSNKTNILNFPTIEQVPFYLIKDFIRGCIDGDGSIVVSINGKGKLYSKIAITGTKEVLEGIQKYLGVSHLKLGQRHKERDTNNYDLTIGGNQQVLKICNLLYQNSSISLERKYEKYKILLQSLQFNS